MRADTRGILTELQTTFRTLAPELFAGSDFNETMAMTELCHEMNRTIMRGGLRSCPAFIGSYNEELGTLCYANAGHTPGLLRDGTGIAQLDATGLPLGLFSHTMRSATACHLVPGAALLVVSRGVIEADTPDANDQNMEFGLDGAKRIFLKATGLGARDLCLAMLQATGEFVPKRHVQNDLTTLALIRNSSPKPV